MSADDLASHHFTVHHDREIDGQVRTDVEHIRDATLATHPGAVGLFLVGGFGRGEGGVVHRDGRWRPANDYDFELITRGPVDHGALRDLGVRLARECGVPMVHIEHSLAWKQRLRGPTEYTVDLRLGSLALHDPHDMRTRLRRCQASRIPLTDAMQTLFTRTAALLWCFESPRDWRRAGMPARFDLAIQVSKALLAIEDARLIRVRRYHPLYAKRLQRFLTLGAGESLDSAMRWATEFKLRPDATSIPEDLEGLWFRARDWLLAEAFQHAGAMTGRRVESWRDFGQATRWRSLRGRDRWRLLRSRAVWERHRELALVNMLALAALQRDGSSDPKLSASARRICEDLGEAAGPGWNDLRLALLRLFERLW